MYLFFLCLHAFFPYTLPFNICSFPSLFLSSFLYCSPLEGGTLLNNKIESGTELRLVPAIESGVTVSSTLSPPLSPSPLLQSKRCVWICLHPIRLFS